MGIRNIIEDDFTGAELPDGTKPVTLTFNGSKKEMYLSETSQAALTALLTEGAGAFVKLMQESGAFAAPEPARPARARRSGSGSRNKSGVDYAAVRVWATETPAGREAAGKAYPDRKGSAEPLPSRGRLSPELVTAWQSATNSGGKPITPAANPPAAPSGS